jgi:hypothetical protein
MLHALSDLAMACEETYDQVLLLGVVLDDLRDFGPFCDDFLLRSVFKNISVLRFVLISSSNANCLISEVKVVHFKEIRQISTVLTCVGNVGKALVNVSFILLELDSLNFRVVHVSDREVDLLVRGEIFDFVLNCLRVSLNHG